MCDCMIERKRAEKAAARIEELERQLPDGMKDCTILFRECDKGHGWLTATNWVQHDCPTCRIEELERELAEAHQSAAGIARNFAAAQAKAEANAKDVERYRWLKECCWRHPEFPHQPWQIGFQASHDDMDAAIDAAMKEKP